MIGRIPLRIILAAGLDQVVRRGVCFTQFEESESGVLLHFSNAQTEKVDILVGADGVHSLVAYQLLRRETAHSFLAM
jgi:salicylate hydroxylase